MFDVTASIVLFKNGKMELVKAIECFLSVNLKTKLYLVDNSPTDELGEIVKDSRVEYIFNDRNLGFGKAHNIVLKRILKISKYHLILNPDVYFELGLIEELVEFLNLEKGVGQVMPKVLYPNGEIQYTGKLLPTPLDLIARRFLSFIKIFVKMDELYVLRESGYNKLMNVPQLSGCFMLLRTETVRKVGLFDERYFMYTEDIDMTRRIHSHYNTIYYPYRCIFHGFEKGSYKNAKLLGYHIRSAFRYFNKWGWFWDSERTFFNGRARRKYL
ncbi:MAG: glycosyltransferase [Bacteroidota bacterium]